MRQKFIIPLAGTVRPVPDLGWHRIEARYGREGIVITRRWLGRNVFTQVERRPYESDWKAW